MQRHESLASPRGVQSTKKHPFGSRRPAHACERCRSRHQKCDVGSNRPKCSNCVKASAVCHVKAESELQIRFSRIGPRQSRKRTPRGTKYLAPPIDTPNEIEETGPAKGDDHVDTPNRWGSDHGDAASSALDPPSPSDQVSSLDTLTPTPANPEPRQSQRPSSAPHQTAGTQLSPWGMTKDFGDGALPATECSPAFPSHLSPDAYSYMQPMGPALSSRVDPSVAGSADDSEIGRPGAQGLWPLPEYEAQLVKYFFTSLVSWFDFCDPKIHFRRYTSCMVSRDASILYAVLALAARHRGKMSMSRSDRRRSNEYERRCFEILIPSLNDTTTALQETALASALLLRLLEEMTEPNEGQMVSTHSVSAAILLQIKRGNVKASSFSDAAMIVALRQEIFVANMTQRPIERIEEYYSVDNSLEPTTDAIWTYRITAHAARVTNFLYGSGPKDAKQWDMLWEYVSDWDQRKPDSFQPIFNSYCQDSSPVCSRQPQRDGAIRGIPTIYFTHDCPVAAQQYMQLCRVLLLAHNPRAPVVGLGRANFQREQEEKMRSAVRIICGVAKSNSEYWPALSNAGLAIAMCGELFSDPAETSELLSIISKTEYHLGWPCLKVGPRLREFWRSTSCHESTRS